MHKKKNCLHDADNNKQKMTTMGNIRARIGKEDGDKEAFMFEERCQELEEEIKHEAAAAKTNLKQKKYGSTAETTEAEAEKEKEKKAVARTEKAVAETDTRETEPHVHQAEANKRSQTTRCNAHSQRNKEMTRSNYNRIQNKIPNYMVMTEVSDSDDISVTGEERPGHRVFADDVSVWLLEHFNDGSRSPSQVRHGCGGAD